MSRIKPHILQRLAKGRHLGWPLLFIALIIISNIATAQFYRREKIKEYAIENFNQQIQCSEKLGELEAQIGYLETLNERNP